MVKHLLSSLFFTFLYVSHANADSPFSIELTDNQQLIIAGIVSALVFIGLVLEHTSWGEKYFKWYFVILGGIPTTALLLWFAYEDQDPLFFIFSIIVIFGLVAYIKHKPGDNN